MGDSYESNGDFYFGRLADLSVWVSPITASSHSDIFHHCFPSLLPLSSPVFRSRIIICLFTVAWSTICVSAAGKREYNTINTHISHNNVSMTASQLASSNRGRKKVDQLLFKDITVRAS